MFIRLPCRAVPAALFVLLAALCCRPAPAAPPVGKPQAKLFITRPLTPREIASKNTHALFEPSVGCYLGAFIDFDGSLHNPMRDQNRTDHQNPAGFESIVGKPHSMYFFYLGYGRPLPMDWVRFLGQQNKFVHIAMEPNSGLDKVKDDAYLQRLADDMAHSGARIFLRFASEMNGNWTPYNGDPAKYREKFRLLYRVMHRRAPNVALVWCPYMEPLKNIPDYYPGDDAVDWVGVNLYNVTYHNNHFNEPAENEHPSDLLSYVYDRYSARKPVMICEYAATHYGALEGRARPDFAARKILTLYNALPRIFPRVKCINYFDSNNVAFVARRAYNDYSVTDDPTVLAAYRSGIASPYFLTAPLMDRAPSPVGTAPMPVRKNELLTGRVRLSCWARSLTDEVSVVYKVNGYPIYQASSPELWECVWDAGSVRPGRQTLTLEVINSKGKIVATQTLAIRTSR